MATITDLLAEARALVDADSTSYPDATLLRRINQAGLELVGKFIVANRFIRFDDTNNTDLPVGTFDLITTQQRYNMGGSLLAIDRLEVKDINGNWSKLEFIREKDIVGAIDEYKKTDGLPTKYTIRGNAIYMFPAPSATFATCGDGSAGAKIYYASAFHEFTTADIATGTAEPGIAQTNPYILAYKPALIYANLYKQERVPFLTREIMRMEQELLDVELNKYNDTEPRLSANVENCR